jgi:hypothetical protein
VSVQRRVEARNRGLDQVSRLTSWVLSGGLVLSGGFAVLAGHAYAGLSHRSTASPAAGAAGASGSTGGVAPLGTPEAAPQATPQTMPQYSYIPPVVSGGS